MNRPRVTTPTLASLVLLAGLGAGLTADAVVAATPQEVIEETAQDAAEKRYNELEDEASDAINAWSRANRARRAPDSGVADPGPDPRIGYVDTFMEEAATYAGSEGAVPFLTWVVASGSSKKKAEIAKALGTLATAHATSPRLASSASSFTRLDDILGADAHPHLDAIRTKNENPVVKGWASFARFHTLLTEGDIKSKEFLEAKATVEGFVKTAENDRLSSMFGRGVSSRVEFAIGAQAPDIEGIDLSGTPFKLSDYDGKIIFLDFWGNW